MRLKSNDDDDGGFRARGPQLSGKEDGGKSKWLGQVKGVWAEGKGPSLWRWARNQEDVKEYRAKKGREGEEKEAEGFNRRGGGSLTNPYGKWDWGN
uniref:Uncharacterized protein n=1 Tax=Vitis vinifera TaxID=29760 RepID=A5BKL8_VITVI|nr:hypothetical protein VITISV_021408 [Vitis vinifera]